MESVFESSEAGLFVRYRVELQLTGRLSGSIPSEPVDVVEMVRRQWAQASGKNKRELTRDELRRRVAAYLEEIGKDVSTVEDVEKLAEQTAVGSTNIFRVDADGLWFPSHSIKQAIKEAVNILFAGQKWGGTRKGPINYVAERVFVDPDRLRLYRDGFPLGQADGVEVLHGRVQGPQGPRSIVTQHEYIERPSLAFYLRVLREAEEAELRERWAEIFRFMESNGIGSHRKMSEYGRFQTARFEKIY
jgi:hypothetical protein